jgi:hypothetical protein
VPAVISHLYIDQTIATVRRGARAAGELLPEMMAVALSLGMMLQSLAGIDGSVRLSAWAGNSVRLWRAATQSLWQAVLAPFGVQVTEVIRDSTTTTALIIALVSLLPERRLRLFGASEDDVPGYAGGYALIMMMLWARIADMGVAQRIVFAALFPELIVSILVIALVGAMGRGYFFEAAGLRLACALVVAALVLRLMASRTFDIAGLSVDLLILPFILLTVIYGTSARDNFAAAMKPALFGVLVVCWLSMRPAGLAWSW